jgi:hypothetical protein
MKIDYTFYFWDNLFAIIAIIIGVIVTFWVYKLSKQLSAKDKFLHEIKITEKIQKLNIYNKVILADVSKYNPLRKDTSNKTYYKQGAKLYTVIPGYGIQFILIPSEERIPTGLVPFEWIEYIREHDSEDNKPIIVCKFKGIKWYKKFKSPFKKVNYIYNNLNYNESADPKFLKFTTIQPSSSKRE